MGIISSLEEAKNTATRKIEAAIKRLEQINSLMSVLLALARYILSNAIEILLRLEILIAKLEGCDSTKDSAVLEDLKQSYLNLKNIKEQLEAYVANYDGKTSPDNAQFGVFSIRVVDEEITDPSIVNKRRRGVALNANGKVITQSDLTFATDTSIIIQETKLKLISLGLIAPQFNTLSDPNLGVVLQAAQYLENDDVLSEDFNFDNLSENVLDSPDGSDENSGLGLNAFINNLKGGRRLRGRVRTTMDNTAGKFQNQMAKDKVDGGRVTSANNPAKLVGNGSNAPDNPDGTTPTNVPTKVGNLSADQRKQLLKMYRSGDVFGRMIATKKLKDDEAAGGPGRYADPITGLTKT
jgi:hypothetical protein